MTRPLPYPRHTWSFTQHAVGINASTTYNLLQCAAPFEGQTREEFGENIDNLMIATDILTKNVRGDKPDPWRDYQQILAELGLIYSTRICRALTITDLGQMFLAREIGFTELIAIQSLRYQYPNGQKSIIPPRIKGELAAAFIDPPNSLIELQAQNQVLIKPGLLILRILIELYKEGQSPSLSASECQAFLIPCRTNSEWVLAFSEIIHHRSSPSNIDSVYAHSRRNIQDWFNFLNKSGLFINDSSEISLSSLALNNIEMLENYCETQEELTTYWIPTSYDKPSRLNWFNWFGDIPYSAQNLLFLVPEDNEEHVDINFGVEVDDESTVGQSSLMINLQPLDLDFLNRNTQPILEENLEMLAESIRRGAQRRHSKTLLHDRIIKGLAETFINQGATVTADPNSIDLFSIWPDGSSAIFEVKTVTRKNIQNQLRLAIGQVEEYSYKNIKTGNPPADRVIVINTDLDVGTWQNDFLINHLNLGLICKSKINYLAFSPTSFLTKDYWLNN